MKKILSFILFAISILGPLHSWASHILGGEIRMETTEQANQFTISMIQFWDKANLTVANRDPRAEMLFYRKRDNVLIQRSSIPLQSSSKVDYQNDICTQLRSLDSQVGIYSSVVTLNPGEFNDPGGYYIVWERCCRNAAIGNIRSPGESGLVFYLEFPPISIKNSSPIFNVPNGDYICKDVLYTTNVGATDADGDELRYSLVTPLRGNTSLQEPDGTDSPKAGYPIVDWSAGFSAQNAIPGNPALSIDARTGQITVTANQLGLFVFTVLCEEYRNGVRIGAVRRDYQSLVIECNPPPSVPIILSDSQSDNKAEICEGQTKMFEVQEPGDWLYQWYRDGQSIAGATNRKFEAREVGVYTVAKRPLNQQCTGTATSQPVELVYSKPPVANIVQSKGTLCGGESLNLTVTTNESYTYEWSRGSDILPEAGPVLSVNYAGIYSLVVRDKVSGCMASTAAEVFKEEVSVDLPSQVSVLRGESVTLLPDVKSLVPVRYSWSPKTGLDNSAVAQPVVRPNQSISYILNVMTENGCVALDSIQVIVIDCSLPPVPLIESNNSVETSIEICPERPVLLQIGEPGDWTYQWKLDGLEIPSADGYTHYASKVGEYSVTRRFKKSELCTLFSVSQSVNLIPGNPPIIDINGNNTALCPGGSIDIETTADKSYTYRWLYEQNTNVIGSEASVSVSEVGMYQLVVTNEENGCISQENFDVKSDTSTIPTPTIFYNGQTTEAIAFCAGETKILEIQNPGDWVYQWYLDGILIQNANSAALPLSKEGIYTVKKNYNAGKHCAGPVASKPVEVVVFDSPEAKIFRASEVLCSGNKLDLEAQANDSYIYIWQFNSKILAETGSRLTVSEGGFYQLMIIDKQNNCSNRDSVFIAEEMIAVELPDKIIIRRGGSTILDPTSSSSSQSVNYLWTPSYGLDDPDALKTRAFPDQTTSYVLVVKTPGGCTAADTTEIIVVDRIYIPDAFTPNGDGINDLLMLANGKELVESINIYNRWGSLVFHSENYENPWDGTFHNTKVPSGNYTYIIRTSIETYKGSIMVLY